MKKNVCVIGAGSSGLVAIKELLDEGHDVTCFEKYDRPGGAFYRSNNPDKPSAYDSTQLTISNYMMAYSSFPPPLSEQRKFWTADEYQEYLRAFAAHFDLERHVRYQTEVVHVRKARQGGYDVQVRAMGTEGAVTELHFDAVAVCTGSARVPQYIELPGQESFKGRIQHS